MYIPIHLYVYMYVSTHMSIYNYTYTHILIYESVRVCVCDGLRGFATEFCRLLLLVGAQGEVMAIESEDAKNRQSSRPALRGRSG